ncbi:1,5-anhydro-D-fructose reductase-like [Patella vulgata]|uniref:1,5-anhydro-D-fructose reductase-like n=1 Tax=Patella vulgata TaxID=6465 RepID=UPI00217F3F0E|nr:1,5-anhydro-D-fructose reductase-like [Patella vulgata]
MPVSRELQLPSGDRIPTVGFGTWTMWRGDKGEMCKAVKEAIKVGYRHIDCAWVYKNQEEVGQAIKESIEEGTIKREDLFVTTKLWNTAHRREAVKENLKNSLVQLGLSYVNLLLIHVPVSFKEGEDDFPKDNDGKIIFAHHDLVDTWKGMEDCVDADLARNIGLSNFNHLQVQRIIDASRIRPSVIQVEINPLFSNSQLVEYCQKRDIVVTAYGPLGAPNRPWKTADDPNLLEKPVVKQIASAKGKTPAQIVLRCLLQRGLVIIPQSSNPARIKENFELFDFELNEDEMKKMAALDQNFRAYLEELCMGHPEYPFNDW